VACEIEEVFKVLAPYKKRLEKDWRGVDLQLYWLVDGLRALSYPVVLAIRRECNSTTASSTPMYQ